MIDIKCAGCAVSVTLINDLTREKSVATGDLICAHREIERHKATIGHLDAEVAKLRGENDDTQRALDELLAQVRVGSAVTDWSDTLNNVMRRRYARECEQWKANHEQRKMERDEARARLAGAEAANAAVNAVLVEHSELNGHIDIAEQCRDYLAHEAMDEGDPSGKLRDFVESLRIVIDQLDRQRRSRNWYEVAYSAAKQKMIEHALDKSLASARDAARRFAAHVSDLGAFADDNDPRAMATAGPIGKAQADLWIALGMSTTDEAASMQADIVNRCAVCGRTLAESADRGCARGNCSMRPRPSVLYAPERAEKEQG